MRLKRVAAALAGVIGLLLWVDSAHALKIVKVTHSSGVVTVRGNKAAKSANITWEEDLVTKSNKGGVFVFTTTNVPADCVGSLSDGVSAVLVPLPGCTPPAFPATGQTTCWDSSGAVIPCPNTGQDGDVQAGAALSYTDNGDGTITDDNTGLTWAKKSDDGTIHDKDTLYTFAQAVTVHITALNAANFAGHDDWRLPNIKELQSILNYQNLNPAVSAAFNTDCTAGATVLTGSCTGSIEYWASTNQPDRWLTQTFIQGIMGGVCKVLTVSCSFGGPAYAVGVRAVRVGVPSSPPAFPASGQTTCWDNSGAVIPCAGTGQDGEDQAGAPLSYADNGDGTITDDNTGLVWAKKSDDGHPLHDQDNVYTWDQAFAHVAALNAANFAGHSDWRLPNVKELQSIVNYEETDPAVSGAFNTNCVAGATVLTGSCTQALGYWSSTSDQLGPTRGRGVHFFGGFDFIFLKTNLFHARAVRGGLIN